MVKIQTLSQRCTGSDKAMEPYSCLIKKSTELEISVAYDAAAK